MSNPEESNPESDTLSLLSTYRQTVEINGRRYQQMALERGTLFTPSDEDERDRLDKQHRVFQLLFDNRLIFPPIPNPKNILDCGYGSGAWCIEVAERYPGCEVIGVDISPLMKPDEIPHNLWLQVDDLNEPFTFQERFDLIHSQNVAHGINHDRWPSYVRDCVRVLKPGGWLQFIEEYHIVQSDNGTITENHAIRELNNLFNAAIGRRKDMRAPMRLAAMMREAGLAEVESRMVQMPLNGWPTTRREQEIGQRASAPAKVAVASHTQYLFSETLRMSMEETHMLLARARQDIDNPRLKPYLGVYVSIGRKPNS